MIQPSIERRQDSYMPAPTSTRTAGLALSGDAKHEGATARDRLTDPACSNDTRGASPGGAGSARSE